MDSRYSLVKEIQPALFGRVLLYQSDTNESVAVKCVDLVSAHSGVTIDDATAVKENPWNELDILKAIQKSGGHQNLVTYNKAHYDTTHMYIEMEHCAGGDLLSHLQKNAMSFKQIARTFAQIVAGVTHLHTLGFAHRDLSLENVLVDGHGTFKVCDFGLAVEAKTYATSKVGKTRYMAPEVASPALYCPIKADMWSLGVILYVLLVGKFPVERATGSDPNFYCLCLQGLPKLIESQKCRHQIPATALNLLQGLLQATPAKRYSLEKVASHPFLTGKPPRRKKRKVAHIL